MANDLVPQKRDLTKEVAGQIAPTIVERCMSAVRKWMEKAAEAYRNLEVARGENISLTEQLGVETRRKGVLEEEFRNASRENARLTAKNQELQETIDSLNVGEIADRVISSFEEQLAAEERELGL